MCYGNFHCGPLMAETFKPKRSGWWPSGRGNFLLIKFQVAGGVDRSIGKIFNKSADELMRRWIVDPSPTHRRLQVNSAIKGRSSKTKAITLAKYLQKRSTERRTPKLRLSFVSIGNLRISHFNISDVFLALKNILLINFFAVSDCVQQNNIDIMITPIFQKLLTTAFLSQRTLRLRQEMPHARPRQHPLDPVRLLPQVYIRDGPLQMVQYPCPCGHELCVQPVLINNHHIRAIQSVQEGRINNTEEPIANHENMQNLQFFMNANHFAPENYVHQEPLRLQYPMYPEVQPRRYRRQSRRRTKNNVRHISFDSDNECDLDRWPIIRSLPFRIVNNIFAREIFWMLVFDTISV